MDHSPVRRPPGPSTRLVIGLGVGAAVVLVAAGLLPWRGESRGRPEPFVDVAADAPVVAVWYGVGVVAAVVTAALLAQQVRAGTGRPKLVLAIAALSLVAVAAALLAVPLPVGSAIGATSDGRYFEVDVPTHRGWGSYLALAAAAVSVVAAALHVRGAGLTGRDLDG